VLLIIEIGTNSTKALLCEKINDRISFIDDKVYSCRIGEGMIDSGCLSDDAINKSIDVIKQVLNDNKEQVDLDVHIICTHAIRSAKNSTVFSEVIKQIFGFSINILSTEEEAICTSVAPISDCLVEDMSPCPASVVPNSDCLSEDMKTEKSDSHVLILDIGGGSTELGVINISSTTPYPTQSFNSFPIGAVSLKECIENKVNQNEDSEVFLKRVFETVEKYSNILRLSNCQLSIVNFNKDGEVHLIGIGGTFVALAMIHNSLDKFSVENIEGTELHLSEIKEIWDVLFSWNSSKYSVEKIKMILKERIDIMIYGVSILLYMMKMLKIDKARVSCKGVRHGYAMRIVGVLCTGKSLHVVPL